MLPITCRTTLYRPVADVIRSLGTVASAAVLSAAKSRLKPTPCQTWGQTRSHTPVWTVSRARSQ